MQRTRAAGADGRNGIVERFRGISPALLILASAVVQLPALASPLTDSHSFRQTQTAFPSIDYASRGIDLLLPSVPTVGPPWILPFEFPIYQALASLFIGAGVQVETALRGIGLVSFSASAVILWALVQRHVGDRAALIALGVYVASPLALIYGHASLVEYPAVLGGLAFVYGTLRWRATGARRWLAVAFIGGVSVALIKITTAIFWMLPAALTRRWQPLLVGALAGVLGILWTTYADAVRSANPNAAWLTVGRQTAWLLGSDRLDVMTWLAIGPQIMVVGGVLLAPLVAFVVLRRERLFWLWMTISLVGPLVAFTNLYAVHDYYAVAITPALAALIGGGADQMLRRLPRLSPVLVIAPVITLIVTSNYWTGSFRRSDPDGILTDAAIIRALTNYDDFVVIIGPDWSPARHFYAGRRGLAVGPGAKYQAPPDAIVFTLPLRP